jgi:hypothetical protein
MPGRGRGRRGTPSLIRDMGVPKANYDGRGGTLSDKDQLDMADPLQNHPLASEAGGPGGGGVGAPETDPVATASLTSHLHDTDDAHDASSVSVNPSGLLVITGMNVQAALAQLDAVAGAASKGLIQQVKITALNLALTGSYIDIPGASVAFTFDGRPVRFKWRFPLSKYSVITGTQALQLQVVDASGGAQNGVVQYSTRTGLFPLNATDVVDIDAETAAMSTYVDGTPFVVGTNYTMKLQARHTTSGADGSWTAGYGANSAFYAHYAVYGD